MTPRTRTLAVAALLLGVGAGPSAAQNSVIDSLSGSVTTNEIASFKAVVPTLVPGESNSGNNYAYGNSGDAMEALGDMYDITQDTVYLDKLIEFCDKVVSIRNTTIVMWNGHIDPVWPNSTNNIWGNEQGDVVSHLGYAAQRIAEHPAVWDRAVAIGDPRGYGRTYRERATRYLAVLKETMDLFYLYYIKADETMFAPSDPSWPDDHSAGDAVPWNQQAMVTGAMLRAARAHQLFGTGATEITRYRKTAAASQARFIAQCKQFQYVKNGITYYTWSYSGGTFAPGTPIRYTEDVGHGGYDIVGFWRAYNIGTSGMVSAADGKILADTLMDIIRVGPGQWYSKVNGTGEIRTSLGNTYTYLSNFRSDVFGATVKTGSQYYADAARKLWIKQARQVGWKPTLTGGTPTPRPTATPTPTPTPRPRPSYVEVTPGASGVIASSNDGNVPANTVDNNLATRWSAIGDGQWIRFDLGAARTIGDVRVAHYLGNARSSRFDIQVSSDCAAWTTVWTGASGGTTTAEVTYDFSDASGRCVRYVGHGNTVNAWNSVTEVSIFAVP